jgi:hypothetical protein
MESDCRTVRESGQWVITVALGDHREISHVINDKGEATARHPCVTPKVTNFPNQ